MISNGTRVILTSRERRLLVELQYSKQRTVFEFNLLSGAKILEGTIVFFYTEREFISVDFSGRGSVVLAKPLKCIALFPTSGAAMHSKLSHSFCWEKARSEYMLARPADRFAKNYPGTQEDIPRNARTPQDKAASENRIDTREEVYAREEDMLEVLGGSFGEMQKKCEEQTHKIVEENKQPSPELCHLHEEDISDQIPAHLKVPKEDPSERLNCPLIPETSDTSPFGDMFPGTKWSKVEFPASAGKWYYLRGEHFEGEHLKAVGLAVPGTYSPRIPGFMSSSSKFYPISGSGMGYWVSWQKLE